MGMGAVKTIGAGYYAIESKGVRFDPAIDELVETIFQQITGERQPDTADPSRRSMVIPAPGKSFSNPK
jgi:hypothetical protein